MRCSKAGSAVEVYNVSYGQRDFRIGARLAWGCRTVAKMHALAFRVMRLCKPSLQDAAPFRLDLDADLSFGWDPATPSDKALHEARTTPFADRAQLQKPADAWAMEGMLKLPQSFGVIYLGEVRCPIPSQRQDRLMKPAYGSRWCLTRTNLPCKALYIPFCSLPSLLCCLAGFLHLHQRQQHLE